jgi:hypothetical protein
MVTLKGSETTIEDVHRLIGFVPHFDGSFADYLTLKSLTEAENQELQQIRFELRDYLSVGKMSEGQVRVITVAPLLRLAGYNRLPIQYRIEEDIARIYIEDEDTHIRGRFDIVVVNRDVQPTPQTLLWLLVIESKNMEASEFAGIAQMLIYAYTSLEHQSSVWGLVTNGAAYQLFYIQKNEALTYQYMPSLNLLDRDRASQLLQIFKAIREWQPKMVLN